MHAEEPEQGQLIVWRVLGFGGRPNPLVFGRVTAALMRAAQALLTTRGDFEQSSGGRGRQEECAAPFAAAVTRLHLYVDDAVAAFRGRLDDITEAFDLLLLLWLALGAPVAWPKVSLEALGGETPSRWIGVDFDLSSGGARMRLPEVFLNELAQQLEELLACRGTLTDTMIHQLCGRAARVAFVVPAAGPFAAALRAALEDSRATARTRRRRAQRGRHAASRFAVAGAWFRAVLLGQPLVEGVRLPLQRLVTAGGPPRQRAGEGHAVVFDASPWGGGAILFEGRRPIETLIADWSPELCATLGAVRGESAYLTFFEAFTVLAALETWRSGREGRSSVAIVGDNIGALTAAVSQRGRGDLGRICREIALRQAASGLQVAVGHLPSHLNTWADALSRLTSPTPAAWPAELVGLPCRPLPPLSAMFRINVDARGARQGDDGSTSAEEEPPAA